MLTNKLYVTDRAGDFVRDFSKYTNTNYFIFEYRHLNLRRSRVCAYCDDDIVFRTNTDKKLLCTHLIRYHHEH